eukprot:3128474-Prymnesium_polylepis.1
MQEGGDQEGGGQKGDRPVMRRLTGQQQGGGQGGGWRSVTGGAGGFWVGTALHADNRSIRGGVGSMGSGGRTGGRGMGVRMGVGRGSGGQADDGGAARRPCKVVVGEILLAGRVLLPVVIDALHAVVRVKVRLARLELERQVQHARHRDVLRPTNPVLAGRRELRPGG